MLEHNKPIPTTVIPCSKVPLIAAFAGTGSNLSP